MIFLFQTFLRNFHLLKLYSKLSNDSFRGNSFDNLLYFAKYSYLYKYFFFINRKDFLKIEKIFYK